MKNFLKQIFTYAIPAVVLAQVAVAAPMPALFYASSFDVNVGEAVSFDLKVNPSTPVYTVGATLSYDPSILSYSDASVDKAWLPLSRAPYEVTDTSGGTITRTAGYPQGLTGTAPFTHYAFRAIAPGDTKVVITSGMSLDAENNDGGIQVKTITIHVHGKSETSETPTPAAAPAKKNVPQTVTLDISGATASYADEAYDFSIMHKLKVAQATVGTTSFTVFNQNGEEVYKQDQAFSFATDTALAYEIPANSIQPGDYTLVATSKYSDQKTPTTVNKPIGILSKESKTVEKTVEVPTIPLYVYIGGGILLLILILMILYNSSKSFRRFMKNF